MEKKKQLATINIFFSKIAEKLISDSRIQKSRGILWFSEDGGEVCKVR